MPSIQRGFDSFLNFGDGPTDAIMVDNADWLDRLDYIPFLRDVGRHFTVNRMLTLDSVKLRLEREQPLTLPRIQLHDHAGLRFRRAVPALWLPPADRRLGPVGQHRQRHRSGPPRGERAAVRPDHAADHHRLRRQDGQDRGGRRVAQRRHAAAPTTTGSSGATPRTPMSAASCACSPTCRWTRSRGSRTLQGAEINEAKKVLATEATALLHGREAADDAAETARRDLRGRRARRGPADVRISNVAGRHSESCGCDGPCLLQFGSAQTDRQQRAAVNDVAVSDPRLPVDRARLSTTGVMKLSSGKKKHVLVKPPSAAQVARLATSRRWAAAGARLTARWPHWASCPRIRGARSRAS